MSFTGDLEHLPIVDVIQLLHATRKSGILRVSCRKGESQLVFKDGFIVSANHLNNSVRIGKILIDLGLITPEILDETLEAQKVAGSDRKPLIITLIEKGAVKERDAYKGLEELIEMTVVEILTWKGGTFTLDVMPQSVADEYRYFPEKMSREINVDTQGILMNALRIFDERKRDGQIQEDDFADDDLVLESSPSPVEIPLISEDDLGLAELDHLEARLPEVYSVLDDKDQFAEVRLKLGMIAPDLSPQDRDQLVVFLGEFAASIGNKEAMAPSNGQPQNILLFSGDELFSYCVSTVCKDAWMSVFATSEAQDIDLVIDRFKADRNPPILLLDCPIAGGAGLSAENLAELRARIRGRYPQLSIVQLASALDYTFIIQAYGDSVRAVVPRPSRGGGRGSFGAETIQFLQSFRDYLKSCAMERQYSGVARLGSCIASFRGVRGAADAALILLNFVAGIFERAVTLIVRDKELIAERGVGIGGERGSGATSPPLSFRVPLSGVSLIHEVIDRGKVFYGDADDPLVREHIFAEIGIPRSEHVLLLPLRLQGKTISITYGDFGGKEPAPVDVVLLEILASHAEVALENALYRKKTEKQGP